MPSNGTHAREPVVVLLGDNRGACHVLARHGIRVVLVDDAPPARMLPELHAFHRCPSYTRREDDAAWLTEMLAVAARFAGHGRPVLFPATDRGLLAIAKFHDPLGEAYAMATPPPDMVTTLTNKASFAEWCRRENIPMPASEVVRSAADLDACADKVPLPCIVKPDYTFELERLEGPKLFWTDNRAELRARAATCLRHGLDVVLQADLSSSRPVQWSVSGLCASPGEITHAVMAHKLRQVRWGAGTAVETRPMDARVESLARRVCQRLGLLGLFEMELCASADGDPLVLEINPRIWSQVRLATAAGADLLYWAYRLALGKPIGSQPRYRPWVGWLSLRRDVRVSARLLRERPATAVAWARSLARVRVID
jgi:predicted ATP-grasp superfamily ATP-dependent carboligase